MKIDEVVKNIEKRFGKEAIAGKQEGVKFLKTGSYGLDSALGGGWARGRIVEIFGWESSGKSTLALETAVICQKEGKIVTYIDMENAMDEEYANNLGVDTSVDCGLWYLSQPDSGETAIEIAREFAKSEDVGLIVVDSVTALLPRSVIAGEAGDQKMGVLARLMSQYIPTLLEPIKKSDTTIIFINQLRDKIGVMFGNPQTTTGGNALKFYASQRVEISRSGQTKDGEEVIANGTKCKVVKNKVAPPFKKCKFDILFGEGIDQVGEVIDIAEEAGIIKRGGSWYSYGDVKLGQGKSNTRIILQDNPELMEEIKDKIININS